MQLLIDVAHSYRRVRRHPGGRRALHQRHRVAGRAAGPLRGDGRERARRGRHGAAGDDDPDHRDHLRRHRRVRGGRHRRHPRRALHALDRGDVRDRRRRPRVRTRRPAQAAPDDQSGRRRSRPHVLPRRCTSSRSCSGLPLFDKPLWLRIAAGIALVGAYVLYVRQTASDPRTESHEGKSPLYFQRKLDTPKTRADPAAGLRGARGDHLRREPVRRPDRATSRRCWACRRWSCLSSSRRSPPSSRRSSTASSGSASARTRSRWATSAARWCSSPASRSPSACGSPPGCSTSSRSPPRSSRSGAGVLLQIFLRSGGAISGRELTSLGFFYAAFIVYVVAFPHSVRSRCTRRSALSSSQDA